MVLFKQTPLGCCKRCCKRCCIRTLPETNSSPLKNCGWETTFLLGPGPFSGVFAVSFREGRSFLKFALDLNNILRVRVSCQVARFDRFKKPGMTTRGS